MQGAKDTPSQSKQHERQRGITKIKVGLRSIETRFGGNPAASEANHQSPAPRSQWQIPNQLGALVTGHYLQTYVRLVFLPIAIMASFARST